MFQVSLHWEDFGDSVDRMAIHSAQLTAPAVLSLGKYWPVDDGHNDDEDDDGHDNNDDGAAEQSKA